MTNNATTPTGAPGPEPAAPRRLIRPREGRIIAGVGAGVARHLNVDPWLVRIVLIVTVPLGGVGLLLYLAGWAFIPEEGAGSSAVERWLVGLKGSTAWIGIALIVVAAIWIAAATDFISGGLAWAVALLVLGVLLYLGRLPGTGKPGAEEGAARGEAGRTEPSAVPVAPTAGAVAGVPAAAPAPRPRSFLGRLTLGTLLITLGVMATLEVTGAARPDLRHYLVAAVLVIGLGLLVGTVAGRSRGLIVLGLLLLLPLFASVAVTAPFTGGFGDPSYRPLSAAALDSPYRLTAGEMTLDLRSLELAGGQVVEVEASVGAGRLQVLVPTGVGLEITGHAGFGQVALLGDTGDGVDVDRSHRAAGEGTLVLDLDVGFGQVDVITTTDRAGLERLGLPTGPRH